MAGGLLARHDHGSQYVSDYFQDELKFLGITSSPAFVREPEGNGVAERFIRTLRASTALASIAAPEECAHAACSSSCARTWAGV
jgi:putative transposase